MLIKDSYLYKILSKAAISFSLIYLVSSSLATTITVTAIAFPDLKIFPNPEYQNKYITLDYMAFTTGAKIITGGDIKNLYDLDTQYNAQNELLGASKLGGTLTYRNPPFLAYIFTFIDQFPLIIIYRITILFNLLLMILCVFLITKFIYPNWKLNLLITTAFYPFLAILYHGQNSLILLISVLFTYKLLKEQKDFRAGLFTGVLLLKPQIAILIPLFFIISKYKKDFAISSMISCLIFIFINMLIFHGNFLPSYLLFLLESEELRFGTAPILVYSLQSYFAVFTPYSYKVFTILSSILFYIVFFWSVWKTSKINFDFAFMIAIISILVTGFHINVTDWVLLLIPIFIFLKCKMIGRFRGLHLAILVFFISTYLHDDLVWLSPLILLIVGLYLANISTPKENKLLSFK